MGHQYLPDRNADVAELADALDLGSSVNDMGVRVSSSAPDTFEYAGVAQW